MTASALTFRPATLEDRDALVELVRTAYRGDVGWTTEAALLADERIDAAGMTGKITAPDGLVVVAGLDGPDGPPAGDHDVVACCELVRRRPDLAYFGMFAVQPALQAAGVGRQVLAHAEQLAAATWQVETMEMTVIAQRTELINWYERRGYTVTDQTRPFPYGDLVGGAALRDDLYFRVLTKRLAG